MEISFAPPEELADLPSQFDEPTPVPATVNPYDLTPVKAGLSIYDQPLADMAVEAQALVVEDDATLAVANEIGSRAAKALKAIETQRKAIVEPAHEFKSSVDRLAKAYRDRLDAIKNVCAGKIATFQRAKELERQKKEVALRKAAEEAQRKLDAEVAAENARLRAEAEAAGKPAEAAPQVEEIKLPKPVMPAAPSTVRTESGSSSQAKGWDFTVTNLQEVPREHMMLDESSIRRAIKAGVRAIPGLKIFPKQTTRFRT